MRPYLRTLSLGRRAIQNMVTRKPLCVSFEITHSCNARCRHCHRGGMVNERQAAPGQYAAICREISPPVIQISGGEPLLRRDVEDIVRALRQPGRAPFQIFVTNAALLNPDRFARLRMAGIDEFSISLDYPDDRHDSFRNIPGLFNHIVALAERLDPAEVRAVTFNCVVTRYNFRDLAALAALARELGAAMNYSPYTWMRTGDRDFMIPPENLPEFRDIIAKLADFKRRYRTIRTSEAFFRDMVLFFENESIPDCRAGERFLVVNPDGSFSPCGLIMTSFANRRDLVREFSRANTCAACNTCIRAGTEQPFNNLLAAALE